MILTFFLAAVAGWAARPAEPRIAEILLGFLGEDNMPAEGDRRAMALLVTMLIAGIVLALIDGQVSAFIFVIGAAVGYFQAELREALLNRKA